MLLDILIFENYVFFSNILVSCEDYLKKVVTMCEDKNQKVVKLNNRQPLGDPSMIDYKGHPTYARTQSQNHSTLWNMANL